ncbi:class III aminotransferase [Pseudoalteromonas sp. NBT06-2]|uniref:aminotransferase class III-fold pyridoxal phosphate-dependent enzyme n=1 Tax=Pseudoalteromonas sp. NBT06-2 TaxID=2025950 RepID=UPI000BA624DE|nr:aminotransferase class III-fold pyridoxal phosphate-dependent enzyme [Pseudoalteromonas sp. NBT06-2]PAJ75102.1 class III aminotransferase [Pseudoalteromonas sp. NBT06-2]
MENLALFDANCSESTIQNLVAKYYNLLVKVKKLPGYIDLNYRLTAQNGKKYILKIANSAELFTELDMQNKVMQFIEQNPIEQYQFPQVITDIKNQDITILIDTKNQPRYMRLLSFVEGIFYSEHKNINSLHHQQLGSMLGKFNNQLANFDHEASERYLDWDLKNAQQVIESKIHGLSCEIQKQQVKRILSTFIHQFSPFTEKLPLAVIHNDINDYNLLLSNNDDNAHIQGVIDFGDMVKSYQINELAIACAYALLDTKKPLSVIKTVTLAYHQQRALNPSEAWVLFPLICARLATSVCNSAQAIKAEPDNEYLLISAKPAWRAIEKLLKLDAKTIGFELQRLCLFESKNNQQHQEILKKRHDSLFKTLSISYKDPLIIGCGQGQYLLDENNVAYLDMVNNVCHVGHCHPKVVEAGQKQMAMLNTNTRYLNKNIIEYSEALLNKMPDELSVVMFVNSGSEANELAMRLMQCYNKSNELIVVDGAYHGNTNKAIEISPYKFNGPGGDGPADNIHIVPTPDPYRGKFKGMSEKTGQAYAESVSEIISQLTLQGKQIGGFICESLQGVGGNLIMPDGYLKSVYRSIRAAGGLCIADEVQVGFGRVGTHWWAFETQNVVPDIVTLGKPIGNGHPLAAVVTTKKVADAFVTGMEYFNTFGGNPVSCAIGKAVICTIDEEKLRKNALMTGNYMMTQLRQLQNQFPIIGDVRGLGLFIGAELIRDKNLTPATEEAKKLIEQLKARNILLSLDGPFNNVLKIKPPIVFNQSNVDYFIAQLKDCLAYL